jgi:hypothetical protein
MWTAAALWDVLAKAAALWDVLTRYNEKVLKKASRTLFLRTRKEKH